MDENQKTNKIYKPEERKMLIYKMEKLKNKKYYIDIFKIMKNDQQCKYTQNKNGLFINIGKLSDETLYKLEKYIDEINKQKIYSESDSTSYQAKDNLSDKNIIKDYDDDFNSDGPKLSNYEKNIIKRNRILSDSLSENSDVIYRAYSTNQI